MPKDRRPSQRANFTKRTLEKLPVPKAGRTTVYDTRSDLGLRIDAKNGSKTFFWFKTGAHAKPIFKTIGSWPNTSIDQARIEARQFQSQLENWRLREYRDPNPFAAPEKVMTLQKLLDEYCARWVKGHAARPEKAENAVRWMIERYLGAGPKKNPDKPPLPENKKPVADWRNRPLDSIRSRDVRNIHVQIAERFGKVTADRIVQLLKRMFYWEIEQDQRWTGANPCVGVKFYGHNSRERVLTPEETARLFAELKQEPNRDLSDFVWLAIATEARRGDVLSMRWQDIQWGVWTVPYPKGGRKRSYAQKLIPEALEVLQQRREIVPADAVYVFPSKSGGHLQELKRSWSQLMKRAEVPGFRIHDLRHVLPSVQVSMGIGLPIIGKGLGHKPGSPATAVYANLQFDPAHSAMSAAMQELKAKAAKAAQKIPRRKQSLPVLTAQASGGPISS